MLVPPEYLLSNQTVVNAYNNYEAVIAPISATMKYITVAFMVGVYSWYLAKNRSPFKRHGLFQREGPIVAAAMTAAIMANVDKINDFMIEAPWRTLAAIGLNLHDPLNSIWGLLTTNISPFSFAGLLNILGSDNANFIEYLLAWILYGLVTSVYYILGFFPTVLRFYLKSLEPIVYVFLATIQIRGALISSNNFFRTFVYAMWFAPIPILLAPPIGLFAARMAHLAIEPLANNMPVGGVLLGAGVPAFVFVMVCLYALFGGIKAFQKTFTGAMGFGEAYVGSILAKASSGKAPWK